MQEPPKIEFPCADYPVKALGEASDAYYAQVLAVFDCHAKGYAKDRIKVQPSRNGRFHSITVFIEATGVDQLQAIFEDLKKIDATKMVI